MDQIADVVTPRSEDHTMNHEIPTYAISIPERTSRHRWTDDLSPVQSPNSATDAEFGDCRQKRRLSPNSATVTENGDCCQKRRLSPKRRLLPNSATVAENGDCRQKRRLSPIVASVYRALAWDHRAVSLVTIEELETRLEAERDDFENVVHDGPHAALPC